MITGPHRIRRLPRFERRLVEAAVAGAAMLPDA